MNRWLTAVSAGVLVLALGSSALAVPERDQGVIVRANTQAHAGTRDDRAIDACARSMLRTMFPGRELIRVRIPRGAPQIFGDSDDDGMPGYQMAVLLEASDPASGRALGSAECDVSPSARVISLRPGAKELIPDPEVQ
ncbi:MAG TPA: hypothetical protein VMU40_12525 [Steroidobacteraceae bacterium]|nr:hypothetical protein [Steroidobacteraceae bacterium]